MAIRFNRGTILNRLGAIKSRRPHGVSRRQRKKSLGFETLEDRRVMSAESPLALLQSAVVDDVQVQMQSYSSATEEGQLQILLNELYWQSLIANNTAGQNQVESYAIPTDPFLADQWHLINTGQEVGNPDFQPIFAVPGEDINVAPVWEMGYTGEGVVVAVIDSGVQKDHPDLAANIHPTLELDALDNDGDASPEIDEFDPDFPFFYDPTNAHGTAVAGLIGAVANNGEGGTGVAPGVEIVPIRLIDFGQFEQAFVDTFRYATDEIDITNNSWGPVISRGIVGPSANELLAIRDSIFFGRPDPVTGEALGVIHVFSAGNSAGSPFDNGFQNQGDLDSATYNGWVSSRYTIGVTGVDHDGFYNNADGTVTSYPETGPNVLIAAPTGSVALSAGSDTGVGSGIFTTDTTGQTGFNVAPDDENGQEFDRDFLANTDYTSRFNGTSNSAPLISGEIALMLEANPHLSWRDVQEILVRSARQNAKFEIPTNGTAAGGGILPSTQNTWITNQKPVFHDPDPFDPAVLPLIQTLTPTLTPGLGFVTFPGGPGGPPVINFSGPHYAPTPHVLTNGAGYTVSQGRGVYGEEIGYAHGTIDAELAVLLAEQWHTKGQDLPGELTFTSSPDLPATLFWPLPAVEIGNEDSGFQVVPGGLGGGAGFIEFWNEYFEDDPFSDDDPPGNSRGIPIEFSVPDNNAMSVETVEVKLNITGGTTQALDYLRILLVSPDGTHSELNDFFIQPDGGFLQNFSDATFVNIAPGSVDTTGGDLIVSFTTNRSWGERSDDAIIFDPTTAEPATTFGGGFTTQGWNLHFENYSSAALAVNAIEVIWHGSPVGANTERVKGLVGVDDNRDDLFNFSRVNLVNTDTDGVLRYGEVTNVIDTTHESMASNVTVFAYHDVNADGQLDASDQLVDQFITGADGNYYFDLVPDDYIFSLEDPLGRTALEDSLTPAGIMQDYRTEWAITSEFFKVWDYDTNLEVPLQADGTPFSFSGTPIQDGIKNLNFLLDPGPVPANQVDFSGLVFADIDSDGEFNGDDVHVPGVRVYGDVNRNGQYDAGEAFVFTTSTGEYSLTVPLSPNATPTVMNVGVEAPVDWTFSNPATGVTPFFVDVGDTFSGVDFAITPPVGVGPGNGSSQPGYLVGVVFNDANDDGVRQSTEVGQSGIDVYIDVNNSGSHEAGEVITTTNVNGAYIFDNVAPGSHIVRLETPAQFVQTSPPAGFPQVVTLLGGGTVSGIEFGVFNTAVLDFGDLPAIYGITTLADDGARHTKGVYYLGTALPADIDAELDGLESADALGDNNDGFDDENGIIVDPLVEGTTGHLVAIASRHLGYLQGWVDFNGDGDFDDIGERIITDELLLPGLNDVFFEIPATITSGDVFARFRYGQFGIDSVTGAAPIGEVEDYKLDKAIPAIVVLNGPDFDEDGDVDGFDLLAWQRGFGMTSGAQASDGDSNSDSAVNEADYADWSAEFGSTDPLASNASETGDFDEDGDTDGFDLLAWQRGFGQESAAVTVGDGDGDESNSVDASDFEIWSENFGQSTTEAPLAAAATSPPETEPISTPLAAVAPAPAASTTEFAPRATTTIVTPPVAISSVATTAVSDIVAATFVSQPRTARLDGDTRDNNPRFDATATFARRARELDTDGPVRLGRRGSAIRFENQLEEVRFDRSIDLRELGVAVNDRVLDRLFTRRQRPIGEDLENLREETQDSIEALAQAFGEETNWRFF